MKRLDDLLPVLTPEPERAADRPFILFGHSLGALIAFELARRITGGAGRAPAHLVVCGRRAPHPPDTDPPWHVKPDDELLADIVALNSMPPDALAEAELLALMLPVLRADLELAETYRYRDAPPLGCPITAVGGLDDEETRGERLSEWQRHTRATFHEYNLPGDHFFVHSREADVNAILTAVVAANSRATISGASLAPPAAQAHASREQR